jgi:EamA domain-containing membrane protein RarD
MKTLSILCYIIGSGLLIASCFTTGITLTWILGGVAVVCLVLGCVFQFYTHNRKAVHHYH